MKIQAGLDTRRRGPWHDRVRERGCRRSRRDRPATPTNPTAATSPTNALAEAVNGPGGYFGGCLAALDDCLRGTVGYTAPATLLWRDTVTAHEYLPHALTSDGRPYDLFTAVLETLAQGGMDVTWHDPLSDPCDAPSAQAVQPANRADWTAQPHLK